MRAAATDELEPFSPDRRSSAWACQFAEDFSTTQSERQSRRYQTEAGWVLCTGMAYADGKHQRVVRKDTTVPKGFVEYFWMYVRCLGFSSFDFVQSTVHLRTRDWASCGTRLSISWSQSTSLYLILAHARWYEVSQV